MAESINDKMIVANIFIILIFGYCYLFYVYFLVANIVLFFEFTKKNNRKYDFCGSNFHPPKRIQFFTWCIEGERRFNFDRLCEWCGFVNLYCYNFLQYCYRLYKIFHTFVCLYY